MELLTTKEFNGVVLQCYSDEIDRNDFWATREQIGQLLEYSEPRIAIAKIHMRNKERLDKFSGVTKLVTPEGGTQETTIYNFKGLLEICRFSNQPKANAVMDFLWEIADEIRQKGLYLSPQAKEEFINNPDFIIRLCEEIKAERAKSIALETKIEADKPKVIFAEAVDASNDSVLISVLAKILHQNGINVGQNKLFSWLRENGFLISCKGERWNMPKQIYLDQKLFELKKSIVNNPDGTTKVTHTTKVTGKGQIYFVNGFLTGKFKI